jgi:hypothetical protein
MSRQANLAVSYPSGRALGDTAIEMHRRDRSAHLRLLTNLPYPYEGLDPHVAQKLSTRWRQPCEEMFEYLAEVYPTQLIALLGCNRLVAANLTFAAEIAGRIENSALVRSALLPLLEHGDPVVREGALYGLAKHMDEETRRRVLQVGANDPNLEVRQAANDFLEVS